MNPMHRRTFHMPDELKAAVAREAEHLGISESEYLRQALYVRIAWTHAVRAIQSGANPDALTNYEVMADVLSQIVAAVGKKGTDA